MSEKHSFSKTMPSVSKAGTGYNMNIAIYAIVILIQYTDKAGLKAQRNWVAAEIHDHQKLVKIVKERSDEMPIRKSIDEL